MAKLEILTYPNPRLRRKAKPVEAVTPELRQLAQDMLETMYAEKGIGLASIQVGVEVQLLVIDTRPIADRKRELNSEGERYESQEMTELEKLVPQPLIIFNPKRVKQEGETTFDEGCLSVPGYYETVKRYNYIEVEGLDQNGQKMHLKLDGLLAICMQHEMDHLDGKVFLDRLSPIKSMRLKSKIKKFGYKKKGDDKDGQAKEEELVAAGESSEKPHNEL